MKRHDKVVVAGRPPRSVPAFSSQWPGVVLAVSRHLHCRCVATRRWSETSRKSMCINITRGWYDPPYSKIRIGAFGLESGSTKNAMNPEEK